MKKHSDRIIAEELWTLLDDISTLSDIIKPRTEAGYQMFYQRALQLAEKRTKYMVCLDGQTLLTPEKPTKLLKRNFTNPMNFPQTCELFLVYPF